MSEVVDVLCGSQEASEPAATSMRTAMPVAAAADDGPNRWGAR